MKRASVAAVFVCAFAALLPWARSGEAVRNGYELARVARSSGAVPGWLGLVGVVAMAVLPVLAGLAALAGALRRDRIVAILAVMAGLLLGGAAVAVETAPLGREPGLWAAAVVATVAVMIGGLTAWK